MSIIKQAYYPSVVDGVPTVHIIDPYSRGWMEKTADIFSHYQIQPDVQEFIDHKLDFDNPDVIYALISALGAGEYWGSNLNADYFPESGLCHRGEDYGYTTFLNGYAFRHHANKDPNKAVGRVLHSVWHPLMKRVELVAAVERSRILRLGALDLWDRLDSGNFVGTSMGCKVRYDLCSICTDWDVYKKAVQTFDPAIHKNVEAAVLAYHQKHPIRGLARNNRERCRHILTQKNRIYPDGRKVYMINPFPRFFDISFVTIPADKTSTVMVYIRRREGVEKAADWQQTPKGLYIPSSIEDGTTVAEMLEKTAEVDNSEQLKLGEAHLLKTALFGSLPPVGSSVGSPASAVSAAEQVREDLDKLASHQKLADLLKKITTGFVKTLNPKLEQRQQQQENPDELDRLAQFPIDEVLHALASQGGIISPRGVLRIVVVRSGDRALADDLWREGVLPPPVPEEETPGDVDILRGAKPRAVVVRIVRQHIIPMSTSWRPSGAMGDLVTSLFGNLGPGGLHLAGPCDPDRMIPGGFGQVAGPWRRRAGLLLDMAGRKYNAYRRLMLDMALRDILGGSVLPGIIPMLLLARMFGPTVGPQRRILRLIISNPVTSLPVIHRGGWLL